MGIGGGKAIDTSKIVASKLEKDIFIIPTIASTCAGTSALSVVYNNDSTFKEFCFFKEPPKKIFIDLETIKNLLKISLGRNGRYSCKILRSENKT